MKLDSCARHAKGTSPRRGLPLLICALLAGCDRSASRHETALACIVSASASPAVAPGASAPSNTGEPGQDPGPRRLLWRHGAARDYALALDHSALAQLSEPERAAVAYLTTTLGSGCEWTQRPEAARDGMSPGVMHCALTDALSLGPQCEQKHRDFVTSWLGDDAPARCAKSPTTAFSQTVLDELSLSRDGARIEVSYQAVHTDGPGAGTASWSETVSFVPAGDKRLRIESRRVTEGKPPSP